MCQDISNSNSRFGFLKIQIYNQLILIFIKMKTFTEEGKWLRNMLEFHLCHFHLNQVKERPCGFQRYK